MSAKVNWCLNSTICSEAPSNVDSSKSARKCSDRVDWNCKKQNVTWRDVSMQEWSFDDNLKITMKNGEVLSIFGVLGACNQNKLTNDVVLNARRIVSRLLENKCATSDVLTVHNIIKHHTGEIVLHQMRHGDIVFPLFPGDLESGLLDKCPSIVIQDHVRCWNSIDEKLVGISLTSPLYSDGVVNYRPLNTGPTWPCCPMPVKIHSIVSDTYNKNYSGFSYLPEMFRMTNNRLDKDELTTCTTCIDHTRQVKIIESESTFHVAERYVCAKCCPTLDESSPMVVQDDNFEKVPWTNAALRHVLLTCSVFKCLTMFSI